MSAWQIIPYQSIGPITLSDPRFYVREVLGASFRTFKRTVSSNLSDIYDNPGVHLDYDDDDKLEFVEVYEPCVPIYQDVKLLRRKVKSVINNLESLGARWQFNVGSYTFDSIGIALYAPAETVEAVAVFRRGYYE